MRAWFSGMPIISGQGRSLAQACARFRASLGFMPLLGSARMKAPNSPFLGWKFAAIFSACSMLQSESSIQRMEPVS
ncbi:hypothetical protein D3C86_1130650 [compost metagenome]